ncbi:MAG TPA: HD domain-containing protein [Candidatus Angelobacter sp.]|nr:HD domain-containing protein [Candidatus Angelobacter sp.]
MPSANQQNNPVLSMQRILAAACFAANQHAQQKRKGAAGEPYINHLLEVAGLIAASSDVLDADLIIAGLLHDVVEDTSVTLAELEQQFGSDVAGLVAEVTDDKSLPKEVRKKIQVQDAPMKSKRAQVIKLADKISNLRALLVSPPVGWNLERKRQYFEWANQVVSRLSNPNSLLKAEFDKTYKMISQLT